VNTSFPFASRWSMRLTFGLGLAVLAVFGLLPALAVLGISFTDIRGLPGLPVHWIGFANYSAFFSPAHWTDNYNALRNTVEFAVLTTVIQITLALGIAVLLNQKLRGRNFYRAVVFMPTVLGVTVIGLIWSLIFNPGGGPASGVMSWFGGSSAFFGDPKMALPLVIFVQIWAILGLSVVIFLAGLQAIPQDLTEAAEIDGANAWQRLRYVILPMMKPLIVFVVAIRVMDAFRFFDLVYVLTNGGPGTATETITLYTYQLAFRMLEVGRASALGVLTLLLIAALIVGMIMFLQRSGREVV
jgi:ABC-type sugar transport system permease subunit